MKTRSILTIAAVALTMTLAMGWTTTKTSVQKNDSQTTFVCTSENGWKGRVWVERDKRGATMWHLMATNTTGKDCYLSGYIIDDGSSERVQVIGKVSAKAVDKAHAESIHSQVEKFTIVTGSFKEVE